MKNKKVEISIILYLVILLMLFIGCSTKKEVTEGSYPSALSWKGGIFEPVNKKSISDENIGLSVGKITKKVEPMPKLDGEINDTQFFNVGDLIYTIKNTEETEAIAIKKNNKYYRIDRIRAALSIVWDNKVYDFEGNFDNEDEVNNISEEIGIVRRLTKGYDNLQNGDITKLGDESDYSYFPVGSKIYKLKMYSLNQAIAVKDRNGKYQKATYIKSIN